MSASWLRRVGGELRQWGMAAYMIARVSVTDPEQYERYKALSPGAITKYGGEFIARGGTTETLEGDDETSRVVIVRFPDLDAARTAYHSPEYTAAKAEREGAADAQFIIVDGV